MFFQGYMRLFYKGEGLKGKDGRNGTDGKDGRNGRDGLNGKDGNNGKDGKDGRNGIDGKPGEVPLENWNECAWNDLRDNKDIGLLKVGICQAKTSYPFLSL